MHGRSLWSIEPNRNVRYGNQVLQQSDTPSIEEPTSRQRAVLDAVLDLMVEAGGDLIVLSRPREGTTMRLLLPLAEGAAALPAA